MVVVVVVEEPEEEEVVVEEEEEGLDYDEDDHAHAQLELEELHSAVHEFEGSCAGESQMGPLMRLAFVEKLTEGLGRLQCKSKLDLKGDPRSEVHVRQTRLRSG